MALAELWIKEDTAANITANKRAQMIMFDTTNSCIVHIDASLVERRLLTLDANGDHVLPEIRYMQFGTDGMLYNESSGKQTQLHIDTTGLTVAGVYLASQTNYNHLYLTCSVETTYTIAKRVGISFLNKTGGGAVTASFAMEFLGDTSNFLSAAAPVGADEQYIQVSIGGVAYGVLAKKMTA